MTLEDLGRMVAEYKAKTGRRPGVIHVTDKQYRMLRDAIPLECWPLNTNRRNRHAQLCELMGMEVRISDTTAVGD